MQIHTDKSLETAHQAREIPQEAFDWYDEYAHGLIDRREFMRRLSSLVALGFMMSVLTSALLPNYALAEQVSFNNPKIKATYVEFDSPKGHGKGRGYLVMPVEIKGNLPAVLVVHENRGLNPYIEDVARRLAMNGFIAFAPDALYPLGGYPGNDDDGRAMQSSMDKAKIEEDFIAAALFLKAHPSCSGKLGAVGFCFGGYVVNMLAATIPDKLDAGVPFYGTPAAESLRNNVKGPLLIHFAELDKRVNASWPDYEKVLQANKVPYEAIVYPGVNHGFHNDSTARYNEEAAESAWGKTLIFFDSHLS
ncbi:dienelactone hydrolase family protein [Vibrio fluvialis]|nr:dienelactone hydrolase family protein [Vibrio fluvialis]EKO3379276.1 dienelactone hydrolase family protein [Vibrio fluvialis]MBY8178722.1 dienelactone hydrolase family protein [Vibrio fluvialis]